MLKHEILKSYPHYTLGVTHKRVTSCGPISAALAPGRHSSEETSQQWRVVGETMSDLIGPGIESQTSHTNSDVLNHYLKNLYEQKS